MSIQYITYLDGCLNNGLSPTECVEYLKDAYNVRRKSIIRKAYFYANHEFHRLRGF